MIFRILFIKNFEPEKVLVDSRVAKFYENLEGTETVEPNINIHDDIEQNAYQGNIKDLIVECINEFSGSYGKSGFCKILTGSSQIKANGYNDNVVNSRYFGALDGYSQKGVGSIIDELIEDKQIEVRKISFGRPVLYSKK